MSKNDPITIEEATKSAPDSIDSSDPKYVAWKKAKIRAAVKHADEHPDEYLTHEQVFDRIKEKFRS